MLFMLLSVVLLAKGPAPRDRLMIKASEWRGGCRDRSGGNAVEIQEEIMKYSQAHPGRVFVVRLEDGEVIHEAIEAFARAQGIRAAYLIVLGGADQGSVLVTGPEQDRRFPVIPRMHVLEAVHEVAGTGTLFPDETGNPVLHMHLACGRGGATVTGCIRKGVKVWQVMEVILHELTESSGIRTTDEVTGFAMLVP
jgi:predicted DNA-binding protein with PD1-like motif